MSQLDRQLLERLLADEEAETDLGLPIRRDPAAPLILSRAQRRMWFLQQADPDSPAYNIASALRIRGPLDLNALRAALNEVVARHEALRMSFAATPGGPRANLRQRWTIDVPLDDLSAFGPVDQQVHLSRLAAAEAATPFHLAVDPLLRIRALQLGEQDHAVLLTMHHIVADGWSLGLFWNELVESYRAVATGSTLPSRSAEQRLQYNDFAHWQQLWLEQEEANGQRRWWIERLTGSSPLNLPTDRPRPPRPTGRGGVERFSVPAATARGIAALARQENATPFITLLAALAVLLHRYCGNEQVLLGSAVAGRNRSQWESLIGLFVNTLVLRCDLSGEPSFRTALRRARDFCWGAFARQDVPFDELVRELAPDRDAQNPLFQVMFSLDNVQPAVADLPGLIIEPLDVATGLAKFDLLWNLTESPAGLSGAIEYSTDLFEAATIERMGAHYVTLLEAIVRSPDELVWRLPLMKAGEQRELLAMGSAPPQAYPRDAALHRLFEQQVERTPDAVALEFGQQELTYRELNVRANRLAHRLQRAGVALESPVAIHLERSPDLIVGLLAILKAGGCYVPLDVAYPASRLEWMLADCQAAVLLTHRALAEKLSPNGVQVVCLDEPELLDSADNGNLPGPAVGGEHLAYVIYTSGSTGVPKGVAVPHRAVSRLVLNANYVELTPADRIAQASNASFDAATFEIWGALLNGARLVGVEREVLLSPPHFAEMLRTKQITTLFLTTALFNQLAHEAPGDFGPLKQVLFGGELVDPHCVRDVLRHDPPQRLLHVYGPTENTTFSTWQLVAEVAEDAATVPIGRAISQTDLIVLDEHLQLTPLGVPGELYVGGHGLAHGYWNRPELTAERFVPHPLRSGDRLYKTGDIVRWVAGPALEFLGRRDNQVKIRGFRIELGEVEAALLKLPGVEAAAVLAREDEPGRKELVAYVSGQDLQVRALREQLAEHLPAYMVPARIVLLERLPLNANGKIDRQALPAPSDGPSRDEASGQPPSSPAELAIAAIWQAVLGRASIGAYDNYFELGGDSITAIQVVSRLKQAGWQANVADLFRFPTVAELAIHLRLVSGIATPAEVDEGGPIPLTPIQLWFFEHYPGDINHFNQAVLLRSRQPLDAALLQQAVDAIVRQHDALRFTFQRDRHPPACTLGAGQPVCCETIDLREAVAPRAALELHVNEVHRRFDLQTGSLLQVVLFRGLEFDRCLLMGHHLAVDGVSWRILLEDLETAYRQAATGQSIALAPPTASFRRWSRHLRDVAASGRLDGQFEYWQDVAQADAAELPINSTPPNLHGETLTLHETLPADRTSALLAGGEVLVSLLTALQRALHNRLGSDPVRITLEGHGREPLDGAPDVGRTVGWFTSLFPFLLHAPASDFGSQLQRLREQLHSVPDKGVGYGVLRYLGNSPHSLDYWSQISFNYLGRFDAGGDAGTFGFADESSGQAIGPHLVRVHELDFVAIVGAGQLTVSVEFHPGRISGAWVAQLLADFKQQLLAVSEHEQDEQDQDQSGGAPVAGQIVDSTALVRQQFADDFEDAYPLSPMQQGLLFQTLLDPDSSAYFIQPTYSLSGALNEEAFQQAWVWLAQRHAVLRSAFVHEGLPQPLQVVVRGREPEFASVDLRGLPAAEQQRRLDAHRQRERKRGFALDREALLRLALFRLADDRWQFVWSYHHIVLDGWCLGVLYGEWLTAYRAFCGGELPDLPPATPFRNLIRWVENRDPESARRYWAGAMADYRQLAAVPACQDAAQPNEIDAITFTLQPQLTRELKELAAQHGATLSTVVQCLWGLLLARYNDASDVVIGAVVSGRPADLEGVERMIGLFINTVPVRVRFGEKQSFADLVKDVQQAALESEKHRYLPLADILAQTPAGSGLFDHVLIFENYPRNFSPAESGSDAAALRIEMTDVHDHTHYDFAVIVEVGESLSLRLEYNPQVHPRELVERIGPHFMTAAECVVRDPQQPAADVSIVSANERDWLLELGLGPTPPANGFANAVEWFEHHVDRAQAAVAVTSASGSWTYAELEARSNQIANWLRAQHKVQANDLVVVALERTEMLVAAILGVLKAGAAYTPVDPDDPLPRLRQIVADTECSVVLTEARLTESLAGEQVSAVDCAEIGGDARRMRANIAPHDLAYVIYTSGSTGKPKGVQIDHGNLMNYLSFANRFYFVSDDEGSFGLNTSIAFDLAQTPLMLPLIRGRTLHVYPQAADVGEMLAHTFSPETSLDSANLTPSHLSLLQTLSLPPTNVRMAIVGGEALHLEQVEALRRLNPQMRIFNDYGPTEATVGCIDKRIEPHETRMVIGRPIDHMRVEILDRRQRLVPVGVVGEIHLGGRSLSRGYFQRDDLNRQAFIADPYLPGERLYKTGDLGRWLPDGNIDYVGRNDSQVKVRGHRIEIGEIETCLARHPSVRQVAVVLRSKPGMEPELAAYLVGDGLAAAELRNWTAEQLPAPMVPTYFVVLESLRLTANDKVDRRSLPEPDEASRPRGANRRPPRSTIEQRLAAIWQDVLQVADVGIDDNFFELGGHSLKAMQIASQIHKQLSVRVPLKALFTSPTIAELAAVVEASQHSAWTSIPAAPRQSHYELSHAQHRLWLLHHLEGATAYNMPEAFEFDEPLDVPALQAAFDELIHRHEALRTAFVQVDGEVRQQVLPSVALTVETLDLSTSDEGPALARQFVDRRMNEPFDLAHPPLLRAAVVGLPGGRSIFALALHHIIGDGWSQNVLYRELLALYQAKSRGEQARLRPLRIQYKDFAAWQNVQTFDRERTFWLDRLAGLPEGIDLPYDHAASGARDFSGQSLAIVLTGESLAGLRRAARRQGTTLSSAVLALFQLLLFQWTGQRDLCLGMSVAGRNHPDLEGLVGFFVNILPIRCQLSDDMEFAALVDQVHQRTTDALEHQDLPFDLLVREIAPSRYTNRQPLVNVIYGFQNFADVHVDVSDREPGGSSTPAGGQSANEWKPFEFSFATSKFDLTLFAFEDGDRLHLTFEYDSRLFEHDTIQRQLQTLQQFAEAIAAEEAEARSAP